MLQPGEMTDISVEMTSPSQTGIHQGQWRMCTAAGLYFGGKLYLHYTSFQKIGDCPTQPKVRFQSRKKILKRCRKLVSI